MANMSIPSRRPTCSSLFSLGRCVERKLHRRSNRAHTAWMLLASAVLLILPASLLFAQNTPHVTSVDPPSAKVNANITVTGDNLGKDHVSAVFLSDSKTDYKATVVDQSPDKIVMKVPRVTPGDYNVSVQTGNQILIEPVRFTVEE
jgi:hypothetical protein